MNRVLILLGIIVISILITSQYLETEKSIPKPSELPQQIQRFHPLTIEGLRQRSYPGGQIRIERELRNQGSFASYIVSYPSDGLKIFALMNIPNGKKPDPGFSVVIINHGYINPEVYSTTDSYKNIADFYSANGFLVLKPDYRGHGQSEVDKRDPLARLRYSIDILNLISSISSIKEADKDRIFMYGHSMGGDLTLRVLEVTDKVKAATLWAPAVTSFPENVLYFIRRYRPEQLQIFERAIKKNFGREDFSKLSTLDNLGFIKTPIVIHHGTLDDRVPFDWSIELDKRLKEVGNEHTFYQYDEEDHNFTKGFWQQAARRDLELFEGISRGDRN